MLVVQVISLGAGKDSLFFRLKDRGITPAGGYLEVDFPAVSTWKARLVAGTPALSALAGGEPCEAWVFLLLFKDERLLRIVGRCTAVVHLLLVLRGHFQAPPAFFPSKIPCK